MIVSKFFDVEAFEKPFVLAYLLNCSRVIALIPAGTRGEPGTGSPYSVMQSQRMVKSRCRCGDNFGCSLVAGVSDMVGLETVAPTPQQPEFWLPKLVI